MAQCLSNLLSCSVFSVIACISLILVNKQLLCVLTNFCTFCGIYIFDVICDDGGFLGRIRPMLWMGCPVAGFEGPRHVADIRRKISRSGSYSAGFLIGFSLAFLAFRGPPNVFGQHLRLRHVWRQPFGRYSHYWGHRAAAWQHLRFWHVWK